MLHVKPKTEILDCYILDQDGAETKNRQAGILICYIQFAIFWEKIGTKSRHFNLLYFGSRCEKTEILDCYILDQDVKPKTDFGLLYCILDQGGEETKNELFSLLHFGKIRNQKQIF